MGRHFTIKTDHHSLKFLLEQKITTTLQQKGLTKLLGLDYSIQYKKGIDNCATDALSRKMNDTEAKIHSITIVQPQWIEEVTKSYEGDDWVAETLTTALVDPTAIPNISVVGGLLRFKNRLYIGTSGELRSKLITQLHESSLGGHSG